MQVKAFSFTKEVQEFRSISNENKIPSICKILLKQFNAEMVAVLKLQFENSKKIKVNLLHNHKEEIIEFESNLKDNIHEVINKEDEIFQIETSKIFENLPAEFTSIDKYCVCKIIDSSNKLSGFILLDIQNISTENTLLSFYAFCLGTFFEKEKTQNQLNNTLTAFQEQEEALHLQEKELFKFVDEITEQRHEVAEKNKALEDALIQVNFHKQRITNSIRYAKRIQQSILPTQEQFDKHFKESFIYYIPKDIVSGDFYWLQESKDGKEVYFGVIDCTGHGVPGALMSMIAYSLLEEAVYREEAHSPANILQYLREELAKRYQANEQGINDGLDICLCKIIYEGENKQLIVSSAKRPFWYLENGVLNIIKGSNIKIEQKGKPISDNKKFNEHTINLKKDTVLYLFTDGYIDQNNSERKRFGSTKFESLIKQVSNLNLKEQYDIIDKALNDFKTESEYRDDITILGLKV